MRHDRSATELTQGVANLVSLGDDEHSQTCSQGIGHDAEVTGLGTGIDTCTTSGQGQAASRLVQPAAAVGSAAGAQECEVPADAGELRRAIPVSDCGPCMPTCSVTALHMSGVSGTQCEVVKTCAWSKPVSVSFQTNT